MYLVLTQTPLKVRSKGTDEERRRILRWHIVLGVVISLIFALPASAESNHETPSEFTPHGQASYNGELIDMAADWQGASACLVWHAMDVVECFDSEVELDTRYEELLVEQDRFAATCSGYLRLYDLTSYGTPVLLLADRSQWFNLSTYGFNNRTSSFRVGPCSSIFADLTHGGGDWYPTAQTAANKQSSTMNSGWNNRVSSVYIN